MYVCLFFSYFLGILSYNYYYYYYFFLYRTYLENELTKAKVKETLRPVSEYTVHVLVNILYMY